MPAALRIFLSHATDDTAFAERLADDLRSAGADVWLDTTHTGTGGDFVANISQALNARDVLVLALSPAALRSQWVPDEMNAAIVRYKQGFMLRAPVVVMATPVPLHEIPGLWTMYQRVDATKDYSAALRLVLKALGLAAPPSPVSAPDMGATSGQTSSRPFSSSPGLARKDGKWLAQAAAWVVVGVVALYGIYLSSTFFGDQNTPYQVSSPGPCDNKGQGSWHVFTDTTQISCDTSELTMTQTSGAKALGYIGFSWSGHVFPRNYSLEADIHMLSGCAGFAIRRSWGFLRLFGAYGGYGLYVCSRGTWGIDRYDSADGHVFRSTSGDSATSGSYYHLKVEAKESNECITVNASEPNCVTDSTYLDTASIGLIENGGSAVFRNFIYTPMP
jgi:hypothetical protein